MKPTTTTQYVGIDLHQATSSVCIRDVDGRITQQTVLQTSAPAIRGLIRSLGGDVFVTFEEGTQSQWLYDVLRNDAKVLVCDPRHNHSMKANKSDKVDAERLSDLLRAGMLRPVYHDIHSVRDLRELVRSYTTLVQDATRIMLRLKALYRARTIATKGDGVYQKKGRAGWLARIDSSAARQRAERLLVQLDHVQELRKEAKHAMLREAKHHKAVQLLQTFPHIGPIRAAEIVSIMATPHRFRTKRQLWAYAGLAVVTRSSSDYEMTPQGLRRKKRAPSTRGLNRNANHQLKKVFKSIANELASTDTPLGDHHRERLARGMRESLAKVTLARSVAAILLAMWKNGEPYDDDKLNR